MDQREVCGVHGWVGKAAFLRDRHDLCEVQARDETPPTHPTLPALVPELPPGKKRRPSVRERGIPRKKTYPVRRISLEVIEFDEEYTRPKKRADCQKCPVCQLVRDGESTGRDRLAVETAKALGLRRTSPSELMCGHAPSEVAFRSRPCVMVGCKSALYLDVNVTGSLTFNFPHLEPEDLPADRSCALDLAERGGMTLDEVGEIISLTRERVRQIESRGLVKLISLMEQAGIDQTDAAATGRRLVGPSQDLEESGVTGDMPGEVGYLPGGR